MNDFIKHEWESICSRLQKTAKHLARGKEDFEKQFFGQAENFIQANHPNSYTELLAVTRGASQLAVAWQETVREEMTYTECENHEPMPVPTETIA